MASGSSTNVANTWRWKYSLGFIVSAVGKLQRRDRKARSMRCRKAGIQPPWFSTDTTFNCGNRSSTPEKMSVASVRWISKFCTTLCR